MKWGNDEQLEQTTATYGAFPAAAMRMKSANWLFGPQRTRAVPWTIWEVILLVPLVASGIWRGVLGRQGVDESEAYGVFNDLALCLLLALPFVVIMVRKARPYQMGLHTNHWMRYAMIGFVSYFVAAPCVFMTNLCALKIFDRTPHAIEKMLTESPTPGRFFAATVMAVLVAPFLEELAFRGILLPWLRRLIGFWPAIVINAAIFAIAHFDAWPAPIALFVLALFLAYLAQRTNSLVASIVLHATFNCANLLLLTLMIVTKVYPLD